MLSHNTLLNLMQDFKENFEKELRNIENKDFGMLFNVNRSRIRDIGIFLLEKGAVFQNILINDLEDKHELIYKYYIKLNKENKFWFIHTEVDKKADIDSIEIIYPQSRFIEEEITKRYGVKFSRFTEEVEELFVIPRSINPREGEFNILPIGIYNKIHLDNHYFYTQVENHNIIAVAEKTGWLYRGIIPLLKYKNLFEDNIKITKRICYTSSFHHNLAYTMAVEQIANITIQDKVKLIRTLLCELERFESHLIWFANLQYLLGFKRKNYNLIKQIIEFQNLYKKYLKCKFLDDLNHIGYTINLRKNEISEFKQDLKNLFPSIQDSIYDFINKAYVKEQCRGIGILEKKDALDAGVTGPCLRASGINYDVRYEKPYLAYFHETIPKKWDVVIFNEGDVYARIEIRYWEIINSMEIIKRILKFLIDDDSMIETVDVSDIKLAANEIAITQLESPQGELLYYLKSGDRPGKNNLGGVYIATPSLNNFLALNNYILKNNRIKNFALIIHSLDLNFSEIDL